MARPGALRKARTKRCPHGAQETVDGRDNSVHGREAGESAARLNAATPLPTGRPERSLPRKASPRCSVVPSGFFYKVALTATIIDQRVTADLQNAESAPSRAVSRAARCSLLGTVGCARAALWSGLSTLGIREFPIEGPRSPFGCSLGRSLRRFHCVQSEASSANEAFALLVTHRSGAVSEGYVGPLFFRSHLHQPSIQSGGFSGPGRNALTRATNCEMDDFAWSSVSPILMLWTAPPPARECQRCGRC
jgi:hypothetical protein